MQLTPEQVKGRIKNVAKENKADARTLMRIYMMERFLERVASSQYKDNFIIKGGMLVTPMKIDISTGDVITPKAIEYKYKLLLDDRSITLWSYNLETILAEKLQTVLARGLLNTRMRDFYDIKALLSIYEQDIDADVLKKAFEATCKKRSTENLKEEAPKIMAAVSDDVQLHTLWKSY